jgi:hypothetical protein
MGAFTGTLNTNGQSITVQTFSGTGTGTRTLTLGASTVTLTGSSVTVWNFSTVTNLTFNANTSTIKSSSSSVTWNAGLLTYNAIEINGAGSGTIDGFTTTNFTRAGTATKTDSLVFSGAGAKTITGTLTLSGNSATNRLFVRSDTLGTARTITKTGATVTASNVDLRDITFSTGTTDLSAITGNSGDCGGNSGITFTTSTTTTATGSSANYSTATWDVRVPLPQDTVVLSLTAGQTLTNDMPRMGKNISATTAMGLSTNTIAQEIYGNLDLTNIATFTTGSTGTFSFIGRSNTTLKSAGKSFTTTITVNIFGGSLTLQDAIVQNGTGASSISLQNGTFDANDFNVTAVQYTPSGGTTTEMRSGTWLITRNTGTPWNAAGTINSHTSQLTLSGGGTRTYDGGSKTYYNTTFSGSSNLLTVTGSNGFNILTFSPTGAGTFRFTSGTTQTAANFVFNSSAGNVITIDSSSAGSAATLAKTGGGPVNANYLSLKDNTGSPAMTFFYGPNSTVVSGVTNWRDGNSSDFFQLL